MTRYPISFLKSLLQKAIRRSSPMHAVMAAVHMLLHNDADAMLQLLRRLSVIMLEDVMLLPSFPALVWLLMMVTSNSNSNAVHGARQEVELESDKYAEVTDRHLVFADLVCSLSLSLSLSLCIAIDHRGSPYSRKNHLR